jgi:chemotaxis protein methyltransferase CheR
MSENALEQAREGIYPASQAVSFASCYAEAGGKRTFDDYCSRAYGRIAMHDALLRNVVFFQHDLVSDYSLGEMNVIFCRNVLIYFGSALRERVLGLFEQGLCRGGFLCLGRSEGLLPTKAEAFAAFDAAERIFRHRGAT